MKTFKGEQTWPENPNFLLCQWIVLIKTEGNAKTACKNIKPFEFYVAVMMSLLHISYKTGKTQKKIWTIFTINLDQNLSQNRKTPEKFKNLVHFLIQGKEVPFFIPGAGTVMPIYGQKEQTLISPENRMF